MAYISPGAQAAAARTRVNTKGVGQVFFDLRHIRNAAEFSIQLTRPVDPLTRPFGQQWLAKLAAQTEAITPDDGGCGIHPKAVTARTVAHYRVDLSQDQHGRRCPLICPAQGTALNGKFSLREKPVKYGGVVRSTLGDFNTAYIQFAIQCAAHVQHWTVHHQLLKTAPPQRCGRQGDQHARQHKRLPSGAVLQGHITQFKGRNQALRLRRYLANPNRHTQGLAGAHFKSWAKLFNTRHNPAVKEYPGGAQHQPESK